LRNGKFLMQVGNDFHILISLAHLYVKELTAEWARQTRTKVIKNLTIMQ